MLKIRPIGDAVQKLSSRKGKKTFGCSDLALGPMTFTSEIDLDMVVTYLHAKNLANRSSGSKVIIWKKRKLTFGCCDLDLNSMTFTSQHDLDTVVTYLYTKN